MTVLELLGLFGGTIYLINFITYAIISIHKAIKNHYMELGAHEEKYNRIIEENKIKSTMGFKTKEEQLENELRLLRESKRA